MQNYATLVKYKDETVAWSFGLPGDPQYGFEKVWDYYKKHKPLHPLLLNFYHVRPSPFTAATPEDLKCMKALKDALGFPVAYSILVFRQQGKYDIVTYQLIDEDTGTEMVRHQSGARWFTAEDARGLRALKPELNYQRGFVNIGEGNGTMKLKPTSEMPWKR